MICTIECGKKKRMTKINSMIKIFLKSKLKVKGHRYGNVTGNWFRLSEVEEQIFSHRPEARKIVKQLHSIPDVDMNLPSSPKDFFSRPFGN